MESKENTKSQPKRPVNKTGKLPPQAIEFEEAILGALMLERNAWNNISDILKPDVFYNEAHKRIFEAIQNLNTKSKPVDILTVTAELRSTGNLEIIGGAYYITSLTSRVASAANIEYHASIVKEKFLQREIIRIASETVNNAFDETSDVFALYDHVINELSLKLSSNINGDTSKIGDIISDRIKFYDEPCESGLSGISSGLPSIDRTTGGWQNSNLIILAARPGMGKTALALNFARNAAVNENKSVAIFSLEMSKESLVDRMLSAESDVYLKKILDKSLEISDKQSIYTSNNLINSTIYIDDRGCLPIQMLRSTAIRLKLKYDISLLIIDYLQLMEGDKNIKGNNREQTISGISRGLKGIAKELNIPVIALSQLSRNVESRPGLNGKRPMLSDLRESGSIEQDADQVIFLYRPEYYGITEDEEGNKIPIGGTEVIFAKNRNGITGTVAIKFNGAIMKFSELE